MTEKQTKPQTAGMVRVDADKNPDRRVLITTPEEDRFELSAKQVAEACCKQYPVSAAPAQPDTEDYAKSRQEYIDSLFKYVTAWVKERHDRIYMCFATLRDSSMLLLFVPQISKYDFELADELTSLDIWLAEAYGNISIELQQIPARTEDDLDRFIHPEMTKMLYPQHGDKSGKEEQAEVD